VGLTATLSWRAQQCSEQDRSTRPSLAKQMGRCVAILPENRGICSLQNLLVAKGGHQAGEGVPHDRISEDDLLLAL